MRKAIVFFLLIALCSCSQRELKQALETLGQRPLTEAEIARGLKEALRIGTGDVADYLGRNNGFFNNGLYHIPLTVELRKAKSLMERVGLGRILADVELKMNRAAEASMQLVKDAFWVAIDQMTFSDVMGIFRGADDAATRYFQGKMVPELRTRITPIINNALAETGAIRAYENLLGEYRRLPMVPDIRTDLTAHAVTYVLDGTFDRLAIEEAAIRNEPVKRVTELLRRVFGSR